jgi:hypothetical protein
MEREAKRRNFSLARYPNKTRMYYDKRYLWVNKIFSG